MKKIVQILLAMLTLTQVYAIELPKNCHLVGIKSENLKLKTEKDRVILIHNISDSDIYLSHVSSNDPGAQAGWTSRVDKNKWSALKLGKMEIRFQCVEVKPGHEQQISCQNILSVCRVAPIEQPKNGNGSYWVTENQTLSNMLEAVSSRGFQLTADDEDNG
ncbi:hypothetical protein [Legionella sp. W05-934-2]|jgi:hypothetical protein|uniref:hypothetical protein n=1 Tax=Legionella sp. W05-934-2 TaxID=1198649 RepID=UPI0034634C45